MTFFFFFNKLSCKNEGTYPLTYFIGEVSFSLVFVSFGFKFHNAGQVNIMKSSCYVIVTGMVPFKILNNLLLFNNLFYSLQISYFFYFLNLRLCYLDFHSCTRWKNQPEKMKKQIFLNLKTHACHYFIISF